MTSWSAVVGQPDQLGESPFWHPEERRLYWVDIPARQIRRMNPDSGEVESWAMPMEPGCIAPDAQRRPGDRPARRHLPGARAGAASSA